MVYVCEFEFWESASGNVIAEPLTFDAEGTFGEDLTDAVESAADWLAMEVDDRLMSGGEMPPHFVWTPRTPWRKGHRGRRLA